MTKGPAMTRAQAVQALEAGIEMVRRLKKKDTGFWQPEKWELEIRLQAVQ